MSQPDTNASRLGYVEPLEHESISHYLGRLRHFKASYLPSAYALGQVAGIGAVAARWEKLYFNPFPTEELEFRLTAKKLGQMNQPRRTRCLELT